MKLGKMQAGLAICAAMFVAACGGGSSSSSSEPASTTTQSGVVVDSVVVNLSFLGVNSGMSGRTDATGRFHYQKGEPVKFFLDDPPSGTKPTKRQIGPAAGFDTTNKKDGDAFTILEILGETDRTQPNVINLSRLLMTTGGGVPATPTTPITLPPTLPAALPPSLDLSSANLGSATFPTNIQAAGYPLTVTQQQATTHLTGSLPTVTVTFAGPGSGTVTATPIGSLPGINNCSATCSTTFMSGAAVTLTATSAAFGGWSNGTGDVTCNNTALTCTFTVTQDDSVTATFNIPTTPPTLTTSLAGPGTGVVSCSTDNGTTFNPCAASYAGGTALIVKATPNVAPPPGSSFVNWTNGTGSATVCTNVMTLTCSFTLNANSAVTANFVLNNVSDSLSTATASSNQGGGSIACSTTGPGGPFAVCAASYNAGTALVLQAAANSTSNFTGWGSGTGSAAACNGSINPLCSFTLAASSAVTGNFNRPTLSVGLAGTGTGSVSSSPSGISCNPTCSAAFNKGILVTLSTSSAGFSGWTGGTGNAAGCSGIGTCQVTLTADSSITASFGQVSIVPNFKFIAAYGNQLLAINPASPGTPTPVKVGGTAVTMPTTNNGNGGSPADIIRSATFNVGPPAQFTGIQDNTIIFPANGHIYRASTMVANGVPGNGTNEPVQVSSAAAGLTLGGQTLHIPATCGVGTVTAPTDSNPPMGYSDPGVDGLCNTADDFMVLMHLNDPSTTPPVTLTPGTTINDNPEVFSLTTGQLLQVLLTTVAGDLQWMDDNLSPTNVANGAGIGEVAVVATQPDKVFLLTSTNLYIYTPSTHMLALPPVVTADAGQSWVHNAFDNTFKAPADINAVYPVQTDGKIFRVPLTTTPGTTITTKHFTPATGITVASFQRTPNKIILQTGTRPFGNNVGQNPCVTANNCNNGLIAVDKTTPNTSVTIEPATTSKTISLNRSFNNYVLYSDFGQNVSPSGAFARIEDASAPATLFASSGNWSDGVLTGTYGLPGNVETLLRAILVVNSGQTADGAVVQKLDSPTGTPVTLGTVSDPTHLLQFAPFFEKSEDSALPGFAQLLSNPANRQPFFVDTAVVGSLTKITTVGAPWAD